MYTLLIIFLCACSCQYTVGSERQSEPCDKGLVCLACMQACKVQHLHAIVHLDIDTFATQATMLAPGLLVFATIDDKYWQLALITELSPESNVKLHLCNTHKHETIQNSQIRQIRLSHQLFWQPDLPRAIALYIIKSFTERIKQYGYRPFMQATIINPTDTIFVIGDIHGSSQSLRKNLINLIALGAMTNDGALNPGKYLIFTGDYEDRGRHGIRVWTTIAQLKLKNPKQLFLLRGNHEDFTSTEYGFIYEWADLTSEYQPQQQVQLLSHLFSSLPLVLLLGIKQSKEPGQPDCYRFLQFCHGGIDNSISLQELLRKTVQAEQKTPDTKLITCFFDHPRIDESGLMWSDFRANSQPDEPPSAHVSERGQCMFIYNSSAVHLYLTQQSITSGPLQCILDAIIRGHQHIPGGINRLHHTRIGDNNWRMLEHGIPEKIERGSVYTCISSPDALASFGCFEDSFAQIQWTEKQEWQITPHISRRIPKRYAPRTQIKP